MKTLFAIFLVAVLGLVCCDGHDVRSLHEVNVNTFKQQKELKNKDLVIDGSTSTIGLSIGWSFGGLYPGVDMLSTTSETLAPSSGEDNHYFDIIKDNVKEVVGDYINDHNMMQLEIYKNDLASLMERYQEAPLHSDNYPDKNKMANSLSTSIISNRFLVEAVERAESMILHYSDIASIHILVLKDAAESYTEEGFISRWWQDLDHQLDHYIDYGHRLQNTVVDWRNDMVDCTFHSAPTSCTMWEWAGRVCYDSWELMDNVWGTYDKCLQVHGGEKTCADHCQAYQVNMNREVVVWIWNNMGKALNEWEKLKVISAQMAEIATKSYTK